MAESTEGRGDAGSPDDFTEIRIALGQEVRRLREEKQLKGRELAELAAITPSFVSQLEQGQAMPSVATLLKISAVLGVGIGELFEAPHSVDPVVRADERPTFTFPDTGFTDQRVSADPTGELQVLRSIILPNGGSGQDLYTHGARVEFVMVIRGTLELYLDDQTYVLHDGDAATFAGDVRHGYHNPSLQDTEVVWVITPSTY